MSECDNCKKEIEFEKSLFIDGMDGLTVTFQNKTLFSESEKGLFFCSFECFQLWGIQKLSEIKNK